MHRCSRARAQSAGQPTHCPALHARKRPPCQTTAHRNQPRLSSPLKTPKLPPDHCQALTSRCQAPPFPRHCQATCNRHQAQRQGPANPSPKPTYLPGCRGMRCSPAGKGGAPTCARERTAGQRARSRPCIAHASSLRLLGHSQWQATHNSQITDRKPDLPRCATQVRFMQPAAECHGGMPGQLGRAPATPCAWRGQARAFPALHAQWLCDCGLSTCGAPNARADPTTCLDDRKGHAPLGNADPHTHASIQPAAPCLAGRHMIARAASNDSQGHWTDTERVWANDADVYTLCNAVTTPSRRLHSLAAHGWHVDLTRHST